MPMGSPIKLATPTMSSVPTMACTTPPPVSPAGAGVLVKKSSDRLPAPLITRLARMKNSGARARITAPIMSPTIRLLNNRRSTRRFMPGLTSGPRAAGLAGSQRLASRGRAARDLPDQEPGTRVDQHRHHEEEERHIGERRQVHVTH